MMKGKTTAWWTLLGVMLVSITAAFVWQTVSTQERQGLPIQGRVPDFALTDQRGRLVSRKDLLGKTWVADFIYTRCPDQCPMMTRAMARVQSLLPNGNGVQLVSISVDPEVDTPQVMDTYARRHQADPGRWHFLTGSPQAIGELMSGFKLALPSPTSNPTIIDHSTRLVLVDARSRIRGYYDGTDSAAVQRLIDDLSRISPDPKG